MNFGHKFNYLLGIVVAFFVLSSPFATSVNAANPITGTFLVPKDVLVTQAGLEAFFQEIKQNNIDTLIITGIGNISKNSTGTYTKTRSVSNGVVTSIFRLAKQHSIKVYWGTASSHWSMIHSGGSPDDPATDEGALIAYSLELLTVLKQNAGSADVSWDDPSVAGLYIHFEPATGNFLNPGNPGSYALDYLSHHAQKLKTREPTKKIMLSPYFMEADTYDSIKTAYTNLLNVASIDIISVQDAIGAGYVTTFTGSAENFRALHDAVAQFPGRQAWANVESYENVTYVRYPPTINRFIQQISAAQPYVSKIITFTYQNSLLISSPIFDNLYGDPTLAPKRKKFYNDFSEYYSLSPVCNFLYYYNTQDHACVKTTVTYGISSHNQCGLLNPPTCESNLASVLPGKTTGVCYASLAECQTANTSTKPGDFNNDGKVDILDYNIVVTDFGNPYTIFDYNILVTYFGT